MVNELLSSDFVVVCICAVKSWIEQNNRIQEKYDLYEVSEQELQRMSNLTTADKVLAVVKQKQACSPDNFSSKLKGHVLVLDQIKNPGNMGTIIRLASWFSVSKIVCSNTCVECYNPKVIQATMGALFHVRLYYTDLCEFLSLYKGKAPVYGAVVDNGKNIYCQNLSDNAIVVIGNESVGISSQVLEFVDNPISIPSFGKNKDVESLNASMATAVILSEFKRKQYSR